jgi:hypothetical protein
MKAELTLTLRARTPREAALLGSVLEPDNRRLPAGLVVKAGEKRGALTYQVRSDSAATVLSTAESLLNDTSLFVEAWLLTRGGRLGDGEKQDARHKAAEG